MKPNPDTMTLEQIERELDDFDWNYVAAADIAQNDDHYTRLVKALDERYALLVARREAAQHAVAVDAGNPPAPLNR